MNYFTLLFILLAFYSQPIMAISQEEMPQSRHQTIKRLVRCLIPCRVNPEVAPSEDATQNNESSTIGSSYKVRAFVHKFFIKFNELSNNDPSAQRERAASRPRITIKTIAEDAFIEFAAQVKMLVSCPCYYSLMGCCCVTGQLSENDIDRSSNHFYP